MPAGVSSDLCVNAPRAEVKFALRYDLIELVTAVGLVCKLIRSLLVSTFNQRPHSNLAAQQRNTLKQKYITAAATSSTSHNGQHLWYLERRGQT